MNSQRRAFRELAQAAFAAAPGTRRVFSVDIFDTVLHRRAICERRRLLNVCRALAEHPRLSELRLDPAIVFWARSEARRLAYRTASIGAVERDVRLSDVLDRVSKLLGIPETARSLLTTLELEEESRAVAPNRWLLTELQGLRARGERVVAISDTWYSAEELVQVLRAHGCDAAFDTVYTSADLGCTKRSGAIFPVVADKEGVEPGALNHMGDDPWSDGESPSRHGARTLLLPRSMSHRLQHTASGIGCEAELQLGAVRPLPPRKSQPNANGTAPLQRAIGPIIGEYCLRLWLYLSSLPEGDAVAAFCARGGLRLKLAFDTLVERLGLPLTARTEPLMVSRLVAARSAVLRGSPRAYQEIQREFGDASCRAVASALAAEPLSLDAAWEAPFEPSRFEALLNASPAGAAVRLRLLEQARLFERHLTALSGSATRVVLCDTGLFASTQRMLEDAFPERRFESALFARANYKGFEASHFARVTGLVVERDSYSPFDVRSCVLRYWHLLENVFEPQLRSVTSFRETGDGRVTSNLEQANWESALEAEEGRAFFAGMEYLRSLSPGAAPRLMAEAEQAWRTLRSVIVYPRSSDVRALSIDQHSIDFGRAQTVPSADESRPLTLSTLRSALWKEGVIARQTGPLRAPALGLLEAAHVARSASRATLKLQVFQR